MSSHPATGHTENGDAGTEPTLAYRAAQVVTEVLAPWAVIVLLAVSMAWKATNYAVAPTALWALVVIVFSAGIPMWVITRGARAGRWDGHHVRNREGRLVPLLVCLGSTAASLLIMVPAHAPRSMVAMSLTMLAVLLVTGAITAKWKISLHTAVSGGGTAMLAVLYHPIALLLLLVVAAIGWSRVVLGDHSRGQVISGALVGFAVSAAVFAPLA